MIFSTESITMSTYTTADVRKMVDDLDDIIRGAVDKGDVEEVFGRERGKMVSNQLHLIS
jgi:hypothetical protein